MEVSFGLFDSGVGGLTVLSSLKKALPGCRCLYLGDTAHYPYGSKDPEAIRSYALQAGEFLLSRGATQLIIACNTASCYALDLLEKTFSCPVTGMVLPSVKKALKQTQSGHIAVLGTQGTISSGAYEKALLRTNSKLSVTSIACPLFVSLAEEPLHQGPIVAGIVEHYLHPLKESSVDTVILGCTHYPLLRSAIQDYLGPDVNLVMCSDAVAEQFSTLKSSKIDGEADEFYATEGAGHFKKVAETILGCDLPQVRIVKNREKSYAAV